MKLDQLIYSAYLEGARKYDDIADTRELLIQFLREDPDDALYDAPMATLGEYFALCIEAPDRAALEEAAILAGARDELRRYVDNKLHDMADVAEPEKPEPDWDQVAKDAWLG